MASKKPEQLLTHRLANYLKMHHKDVAFRFDLIDMVGRHGGAEVKKIHGENNKGHPDLIIFGRNKPLLLELKATRTVANTEHTRTQARNHARLRLWGYEVHFCCGYEECVNRIRIYMEKRGKLSKT